MVMAMDTYKIMYMVAIWHSKDMVDMVINIKSTEKGPRNTRKNPRNQRDGARGNIERLCRMRNTDMDVVMARGWSMMKMSSNIMSEMVLLTELLSVIRSLSQLISTHLSGPFRLYLYIYIWCNLYIPLIYIYVLLNYCVLFMRRFVSLFC